MDLQMSDIAEMTVFQQGIKISWHVVPLGQRTRVMDRQTDGHTTTASTALA